jgi:death-on-curing protein
VKSVEYLDLEDLLTLATALLGDPALVRDLGLLEAASSRPRASAFGEDAYPDVWSKAAALLQSIVKSHPLVDGNKRLGWLATAVLLELNDVEVTGADNDVVYELVMSIAAGEQSIEEIAGRLRMLALD